MSEAIVRWVYPDRAEERSAAAETGNADAAVSLSVRDGVRTLTLTPRRAGLRLTALEYETDVPARLLRPRASLYVYDNGANTNDVTAVRPYAACADRPIAEMALFRNLETGALWLAGLLTAHRFLASLRLRGDRLAFRFELEERELREGEPYVMERFLLLDGTDGEARLLERYADTVAVLNRAVPYGPTPVGFCSWSRYYSEVDEAKIRRAADAQAACAPAGTANLVQIDDGWQQGGSFCGKWVPDEAKFPSGLADLSRYVRARGMTTGLWLAPLLLDDRSPFYGGLRDMALDVSTLGDGHVHPFDLGDPRFLRHLEETFLRLRDECGVRYFKLDFLAAAVRYFGPSGGRPFVSFPGGFCVELLRNALRRIRGAVGDDVFLLSCGAPTLVGAGVFNGARMSCDIIWGKSPANPPYFSIVADCIRTVLRRSFLHRRVFLNDPDGLVVRGEDVGDGFACTPEEAGSWALAVGLSGGSVLLNEEAESLSPERLALYTELLPAPDLAARPTDFFELPFPSSYVLEIDERTKFLALFRFEDQPGDLSFDLNRVGMRGALVADCRARAFLGFRDAISIRRMRPHSSALFLLRLPGPEPAFAGADTDLYLGVHRFRSRWADGRLTVLAPKGTDGAAVYALWPDGTEPEGEIALSGRGCTLTRLPADRLTIAP